MMGATACPQAIAPVVADPKDAVPGLRRYRRERRARALSRQMAL